jgi:hypothetical protein
MFSISKLIKLWALGKFFTSRTSLLNSLLAKLAAIIIIGIVISVLIGAALAGGLAFGYNELLLHGVDRYTALSITVAALVALIAILALVALHSWRRFRKLTHKLLMHQAPFALRIQEIAGSFLEGLMGD